jgi:hypothetical protein
MKLVIKYQISAINNCWENCDEKWAYMFNVYKNQLYKNLAEIDDKDLTVDEKTKHLNNDFYHE